MTRASDDPFDDAVELALKHAFQSSRHSSISNLSDSGAATGRQPIPETIGRFRVEAVVDEGGIGIVLRAHDPDCDRKVAIKLLRDDGRSRERLASTFIDEARTLARLEHPAIVPVHEIGQLEDGRVYFVMKLVHGVTFAELLERRRSPASDLPLTTRIFQDVCRAMAYAHDRGIIHRDLKPANVMLGELQEVRIIDWGFAHTSRDDEDAPDLPRLLGTPAYMSPEQARGEVDALDPRSDVFSLGAILCEILTGSPPYDGQSSDEIVLKAAKGWNEPALERLDSSQIDSKLGGIARRCLQMDPADRPQHAGEVAGLLTSYFGGLEERARRLEVEAAERRARDQQQIRVRRRTRVVVVTALVAAVIVGALWLRLRDRELNRRQAIERGLERAAALIDDSTSRFPADPDGWAKAVSTAQEVRAQARTLSQDHDLVRIAENRLERAEAGLQRATWLRSVKTRLDNAIHDLDHGTPLENLAILMDLFREIDLDLTAKDPQRVGDALRDHPLRAHLLDAFDEVFLYGVYHKNEELLSNLVVIGRRSDPDPVRQELREALEASRFDHLEKLAKASNLDEMTPATVRLIARPLEQARRPDLAFQLLRRARFRYPDDFRICHDLGVMLMGRDHYAEAIRTLSMAVSIRPRSGHIWGDLAGALLCQRRFQEGLAAADESLRLHPHNATGLAHRCWALRELGRGEEALALARKGLEHHPRSAMLTRSLAASLTFEKRRLESIQVLRNAWARDLRTPEILTQLSSELYSHGDLDGLEELTRPLLGNPRLGRDFRLTLAQGLSLRRDPEAADLVTQVMSESPRNARAYWTAGMVFQTLGRIDEAIKAFRKAEKLIKRFGGSAPFPIDQRLALLEGQRQAMALLESKTLDQMLEIPVIQRLDLARVAGQRDRHAIAAQLFESFLSDGGPHKAWNGFEAARSAAATGLGLDPEAGEPANGERWLALAHGWLRRALRDFERRFVDTGMSGYLPQLIKVKVDPVYAQLRRDDADGRWLDLWADLGELIERMRDP